MRDQCEYPLFDCVVCSSLWSARVSVTGSENEKYSVSFFHSRKFVTYLFHSHWIAYLSLRMSYRKMKDDGQEVWISINLPFVLVSSQTVMMITSGSWWCLIFTGNCLSKCYLIEKFFWVILCLIRCSLDWNVGRREPMKSFKWQTVFYEMRSTHGHERNASFIALKSKYSRFITMIFTLWIEYRRLTPERPRHLLYKLVELISEKKLLAMMRMFLFQIWFADHRVIFGLSGDGNCRPEKLYTS